MIWWVRSSERSGGYSRVDARPRTLAVCASESSLLDRGSLGGGVGASLASARTKATFETIERLVTNHTRRLAYLARGIDIGASLTLHRSAYACYLDEQFDAQGFPYRAYDERVPIFWINTRRVRDNALIAVPADCLGTDRALAEHNRLFPQSSSATAAFNSVTGATENALLELVERDIVTRCWFKRFLTEIPVSDVAPAKAAGLLGEDIELSLYLCGESSLAPVVIALLRDCATRAGAAGAAAGCSFNAAVSGAINNAATMFAAREQTGTLARLPDLDVAAMQPDDLRSSVRWDRIISHYDPTTVLISDSLLHSRNIFVVRAWSAQAVDFPKAGEPLPLSRWRPSGIELDNTVMEKELF